jgi:hypothetical protein
MKIWACAVICLIVVGLSAFPITDYDYHTPDRFISPVTAGMGGLNLTVTEDPAVFYGNPAGISNSRNPMGIVTFSLRTEDGVSDLWKVSNLLRKKHLDNMTLTSSKVAFAYLPIADTENRITESDGVVNYRDYTLQSLQLVLADQKDSFSYGMNVKYLWGRVVDQNTRVNDDGETVLNSFIDTRAQGYSTDLGMTISRDNTRFGLSAYDVLSTLYWDDHANARLTPRGAASVQFGTGNSAIVAGVQAKLYHIPQQTWHFGLTEKIITGGTKSNPQGWNLRAGVWSHDFKNSKTVFTSLGVGFQINAFHLDTSLVTNEMKIANARYLLSLSMGM